MLGVKSNLKLERMIKFMFQSIVSLPLYSIVLHPNKVTMLLSTNKIEEYCE